MARPLRIDFPGAWHHVMNRGAGRRPIFACPRHHRMFLSLVGEIAETFRVEIHAYCLMPNHYHLLLHTPHGGLSRAMRHLDGVYTQRFNRRASTDGPLFRGRFRSVLVDADVYLARVSRYIHLNPVKAGLADRPERYGWSSYPAYVGRVCAPVWLHRARVLEVCGAEEGGDDYRRFVEAGIDEQVAGFYGRARLAPVLGRDEFRRRIDESIRERGRSREVPDRARVRPRPTIDSVTRAVAEAFHFAEEDLRRLATNRGPGPGLARGAIVYLARREGAHSLRSIARQLAYGSDAGAATAMRRLAAAIVEDTTLRRKLELARRLLLMNQNET